MVQKESENIGGEIAADAIWKLFDRTYLNNENCLTVDSFQLNNNQLNATLISRDNSGTNSGNNTFQISGRGNGLLESAVNGLQQRFGAPIEIMEYSEHALNHGTESKAVAYIKIRSGQQYSCGVAIHQDMLRSIS